MKTGSRFKLYNSFMIGIFLLSALVQYNDPDPLLWIIIYGIAALVSYLAFSPRLDKRLPLYLAILAFGWAAFHLPDVWGKVTIGEIFQSIEMKTIAVEKAREMGGLAIIASWMLYLYSHLRKTADTN